MTEYLFLLLMFFACELLYFWFAKRFNIIAKPNSRSSHNNNTLLGGGIVFYIAMLVFFVVSKFQYPWFFLALSLVAIVSFIDDIKPYSSKIRLFFQLFSMAILAYQVGIYEYPWFLIVVFIIVAGGILNTFNFMDGINGMIGLNAFVVSGALWCINRFHCYFIDEQIINYLLLALIVFNFFNFRKKPTCFAGDVGAISLATIIVFLLSMLILKTNNIAWIGLLAVFGVDVILTIIHRLILKENIFEAHRSHLFQLLVNELKFSHLLVSVIYAVIQAVVIIGLIVFRQFALFYLIGVILLLSIIYYVLVKKYFYLHQLSRNAQK